MHQKNRTRRMHIHTMSICFILLLHLVILQADGAFLNPYAQCSEDANITSDRIPPSKNNTILSNLLSTLAANAPLNGGFYNTSSPGDGTNKLYGLVQCRGDISYSNCSACAKSAATTASEGCNDHKSSNVMVWNPTCFIRYSYHDFFGTLVFSDSMAVSTNSTDLQDPANVTAGLNLMSEIAGRTPDQPLMFYGEDTGTMHGMAQCTRDMSEADCGMCLNGMLANYTSFVMNQREWVIYGASCRLWYLNDQLYVNASASSANSMNYYHSSSTAMIISLLITIAIVTMLLV